LIFLNHRRVSVHCSLHNVMPRNLHFLSSLLRLRPKVCLCDDLFPILRRVNLLLWPFWPYSRQGPCHTVLAEPNLLALL
jgi:hypothetical protein